MNFNDRFSGYSNEELSNIDTVFSDILKIERDGLLKIFECRDLINNQIDCISVNEKIAESQQELLDTLFDSMGDLFKKFFINYCKSKNLLKFSNNFSNELKRYDEIDDSVRYNIGARIFHDVKSDDILDLFDKPLEYHDIYAFVDDFVSGFVDSIYGYLLSFLQKGSSEQFIKDFMIYFKNILSELVKLKISEEKNLDLNGLFSLISDVTFASVDKKSVNDVYFEFLVSHTYSEFLEKPLNLSGDDTIDNDFNDVDVVVPCVVQLLHCTSVKDSDILNKLSSSILDRNEVESDILSFVLNVLNIGDEFKGLNDYDFNEKIYTTHLDETQYGMWKKMFIKRIKLPLQTGDLKLMDVENSTEIMNFISEMREKYPKAKKHIGKIGAHNLKEMKVNFLKTYLNDLLDDLSGILDNESFKKLSLIQLFKMMYIYVGILKGSKFDLNSNFEKYIEECLEKSFSESHQSVENKEGGSKNSLLKVERVEKPESLVVDEKPDNEQIQKKEGLPSEILEDINFYFENIDTSFPDDKKRAVIKAVEKLPFISSSDADPYNKYYKKSRFKGFDFSKSDIFFEILDKYYECEEEPVDYVVVSCESGESSIVNSDYVAPIANQLLVGLDNIDNINGKVDYCIDVLKSLGYTFYKDELKIKEDILDFCKNNFSSFLQTVINLANGTQGLRKKRKRWENKPVYCLDIGRTGFRLVCLSKSDSEKKAIYAFMGHNDYTTFLDGKCSG